MAASHDVAKKMGQKGGSKNTEAQRAARLRNIAGQSRPRKKASERPQRIVQRVEHDLQAIRFPYVRFQLDGSMRNLTIWVPDERYRTEEVARALYRDLVRRFALPEDYGLTLRAPELGGKLRRG